jgi:propionyl-CoA carboxylase alpha chain/3-methylcrotonyl-CoA carboxylase alpha subunit
MITGLDLVEWQIRIARGEPLPLAQGAIPLSGHAMEARLYAENPARKFLPSTGPLQHFRLPDQGHDIRIDTGVEQGGEVTPFYDPMIAKIIVHADTREAAARKLSDACAEVEVWPVKTNAGFLSRCAAHPDFVAGHVETGFIEARLDALVGGGTPSEAALAVAAVALVEMEDRDPLPTPWAALGGAMGFRLNADPRAEVRLESSGALLTASLIDAELADDDVLVTEDGVVVFDGGDVYAFRWPEAERLGVVRAGNGLLTSPMPGRIVSVGANAGARVKKGQPIVTLEAMKMEHALVAPFDGKLVELNVKVGDQVSEGVPVARIADD